MILQIKARGDQIKNAIKTGQKRGEIVHISQLDTYSYFIIYEVYSLMNSNRMSISMVIHDKEDYTELHAVSTGGGKGMIFRFDWGSGKGFEEGIKTIIKNTGFEYREINN